MDSYLLLPGVLQVGQGIRRALEAGVCSRQELFVTSKLWNTYHAPEHVESACRWSRSSLMMMRRHFGLCLGNL